jgi:hypothetical protein
MGHGMGVAEFETLGPFAKPQVETPASFIMRFQKDAILAAVLVRGSRL